jgi:hypothetical protein
MGLFGFGKRRSPIEQQLIDLYGQMLTMKFGSSAEARKAAEEWVDQAKAQAEAEGTVDLANAAESYLAKAQTDPAMRAKLEAKRADGVTDADIRWWWNLHDLERRMMALDDDNSKVAFIIHKTREQGLTVEQAAAELRRSMPIYGDPADTRRTTGDDRPLPYELKDRVNRWLQTKMPDPDRFRRQLAQATTYNALVRAELRAGKV